MLSREEAKENIYKVMDLGLAIDKIYDSIGSCDKCKHSEPMHQNRWCNQIQRTHNEDWFCANFERKEDDS